MLGCKAVTKNAPARAGPRGARVLSGALRTPWRGRSGWDARAAPGAGRMAPGRQPSQPAAQTWGLRRNPARAVAREGGRWAALGPSAARTGGGPAHSAARRSAARQLGARQLGPAGAGRNAGAGAGPRRAAPGSLDDGARPGLRAGAGPRRAGQGRGWRRRGAPDLAGP